LVEIGQISSKAESLNSIRAESNEFNRFSIGVDSAEFGEILTRVDSTEFG